jgi:hypothetical protein
LIGQQPADITMEKEILLENSPPNPEKINPGGKK